MIWILLAFLFGIWLGWHMKASLLTEKLLPPTRQLLLYLVNELKLPTTEEDQEAILKLANVLGIEDQIEFNAQ